MRNCDTEHASILHAGAPSGSGSSEEGSFNSPGQALAQPSEQPSGSDSDSDWDRYTSNEDDEFDERALERRRDRVAVAAQPAARQREQSLFGLTDKRTLSPLKCAALAMHACSIKP